MIPLPPGVPSLVPPLVPYEVAPSLPIGRSSPALYVPWTPTRHLTRRKKLRKRLGFLMAVLEREQEAAVVAARPLPDFRVGDILEVRVVVPENERKEVLYKGVCISRDGTGWCKAFKIYNVYADAGGVVQHFPLYMPDLVGVRVIGHMHDPRDKLYHLLGQEGRELMFQMQVQVPKAPGAGGAKP